MASTRTGVAHYMADCLTCGAVHRGKDRGSAARSWGVRHVDANPGHVVHVQMERVLVIETSR